MGVTFAGLSSESEIEAFQVQHALHLRDLVTVVVKYK